MKKGTTGFVAGFVLGAVMFGGVAAYAAGIIANPTTSKILVNGQEVKVEAYNIDGRNYLQLRDMAAAVDFSVVWDGGGNRALIDTSKGYDKNEQYVPDNAQTIPTPAALRPTPVATKTGDVIKTTDCDYTIKKGKPAEEPLPAPDPEWAAIYPSIVMPVETPVRSKGVFEGVEYDQLDVFNAYETQRMIDTMYKYAPTNTSLWEDNDPATHKPSFSVAVELTTYSNGVNHFYPWRESEIEKQIKGGAKIYKVYAMDIYSHGNYLYTKYCIDPALS